MLLTDDETEVDDSQTLKHTPQTGAHLFDRDPLKHFFRWSLKPDSCLCFDPEANRYNPLYYYDEWTRCFGFPRSAHMVMDKSSGTLPSWEQTLVSAASTQEHLNRAAGSVGRLLALKPYREGPVKALLPCESLTAFFVTERHILTATQLLPDLSEQVTWIFTTKALAAFDTTIKLGENAYLAHLREANSHLGIALFEVEDAPPCPRFFRPEARLPFNPQSDLLPEQRLALTTAVVGYHSRLTLSDALQHYDSIPPNERFAMRPPLETELSVPLDYKALALGKVTELISFEGLPPTVLGISNSCSHGSRGAPLMFVEFDSGVLPPPGQRTDHLPLPEIMSPSPDPTAKRNEEPAERRECPPPNTIMPSGGRPLLPEPCPAPSASPLLVAGAPIEDLLAHPRFLGIVIGGQVQKNQNLAISVFDLDFVSFYQQTVVPAMTKGNGPEKQELPPPCGRP
ncbi:hypothetical protein PAPYR_4301 [Paratrimastix pyriformis]|uniref:Uncharacterized protein n=1 Tax=Paratrimastix pyriformis TaxID=342808 RepID=A0ABQ8UM91_9EUKA|nr:hypothetical protein PAPYR_4301 [Paratrimastix pyriformis]